MIYTERSYMNKTQKISEIYYKIFGDTTEFFKLFKNKFFFISLIIFVGGVCLNFISQIYLFNLQTIEGKFPPLFDLIHNYIPYIPIGFIYDWGMLVSILIFIIYIIYSREYKKIPYFLMIFGFSMLLRSIFVVLTPLGNPENFNGTNSKFKGFSKYELGLYPSGHTATSFNNFLLSKGFFKIIFLILTFIIIISLLLTRGHYSIDIISGLIFAYAINCFGERYLSKNFGGN